MLSSGILPFRGYLGPLFPQSALCSARCCCTNTKRQSRSRPWQTNRWSHRSHRLSSAFSSRHSSSSSTGHRGSPSNDGTNNRSNDHLSKIVRKYRRKRGPMTEGRVGRIGIPPGPPARASPGAAVVGSGAGAIDTSHLDFRPIQKIATIHASSGLAGLYGTGTNNWEVSRESSRDQFGCWRCALRHHVSTGMGDAHEQSRLRSERSHAGPKRALCVQSVRVPVATELLSPLRLRLSVVLRLWTRLLRLWSKLLRLRTKLPVLPLRPLRGRKLKALMSIALNSAADDDAMDWIAAN